MQVKRAVECLPDIVGNLPAVIPGVHPVGFGDDRNRRSGFRAKVLLVPGDRRVGILAEVHNAVMLRTVGIALVFLVRNKLPAAVFVCKVADLVEAPASGQHPLNGPVLKLNRVKVRAFSVQIAVGRFTRPINQVVGGVNAQRAACNDHKPFVSPAENVRVAEVPASQRVVRPIRRNVFDLVPRRTIIRAGGKLQALAVSVRCDERNPVPAALTVKQPGGIVRVRDDRAVKHGPVRVRVHRNRMRLPCQQILAGHVQPVHRPPAGIVIKLVEHMVNAGFFVVRQTMDIVCPTVLHRIMELSAIRLIIILRRPAVDVFAISQLCGRTVRRCNLACNGQVLLAHLNRNGFIQPIFRAVFIQYGNFRAAVPGLCIYFDGTCVVADELNPDRLGGDKLRFILYAAGVGCDADIGQQRGKVVRNRGESRVLEGHIAIKIQQPEIALGARGILPLVFLLMRHGIVAAACNQHVIDVIRNPGIDRNHFQGVGIVARLGNRRGFIHQLIIRFVAPAPELAFAGIRIQIHRVAFFVSVRIAVAEQQSRSALIAVKSHIGGIDKVRTLRLRIQEAVALPSRIAAQTVCRAFPRSTERGYVLEVRVPSAADFDRITGCRRMRVIILKTDIGKFRFRFERQKSNITALPIRDGSTNGAFYIILLGRICVAKMIDELAVFLDLQPEMQRLCVINAALFAVIVGVAHPKAKDAERVCALPGGIYIRAAPFERRQFFAANAKHQRRRAEIVVVAVQQLHVGFQHKRLCFFVHAVIDREMVAACALHMDGIRIRLHKIGPQGAEVRAGYFA